MMTRTGVGALTIVDRDFVEESNLQRQSLFDERDAALGLPKAVAAEERLRGLNSEVAVRGIVADVTADNAPALVEGASLVLDGTDNFETRFLLNDVCLRAGIPWIYGACVGAHGLVLVVRPRVTPCLRCVLHERPEPGTGETCDTAGVIAPIVHLVASVQAAEALKLLAGREEALLPGLASFDIWTGFFEVVDFRGQAPSCPACTRGQYEYADAERRESAVLCGRDAVQLRPPQGTRVDLRALAVRLAAVGEVLANEHLVRFTGGGAQLVVFGDGRAIVKGVRDVPKARSIYARYVGI
jgi:adenylyltransferase/sulfurtransferase